MGQGGEEGEGIIGWEKLPLLPTHIALHNKHVIWQSKICASLEFRLKATSTMLKRSKKHGFLARILFFHLHPLPSLPLHPAFLRKGGGLVGWLP